MDKEITDIAPTNLEGTVVNTVKKASEEDVEAAALAEKEKKENYYVDPLEQDAIMKEKLEKIEAERAKNHQDDDEEDEATFIDTSIRPDMNVSGYFSSGNTAKKPGIMKRSATGSMLTFGMVFSIFSAAYSVFYLVVLIADNFSSPLWYLGWLYAAVAVTSLFVIFNSIRSLGVKNDSLKAKALVGIIGSAFVIFPFFAWIINIITQSM